MRVGPEPTATETAPPTTTMIEPPTATCMESCCCVVVKPRKDLAQWLLVNEETLAPSPMMYFLGDCSGKARVKSGIDAIPQISSLAGATLQRGEHSTGGSVQTLKWAVFDAEKRVAHLEVFGGAGKPGNQTGQWTEPNISAWYCLINLARCCDYSYVFHFSEDWRRADIDIKANCCCLCCVPPCVPAWFTLPRSLVAFEMVQAEDSTDGSRWIRNSSVLGKPYTYTYDLVEVLKPDATPGRFHADLARVAPEQMLISR